MLRRILLIQAIIGASIGLLFGTLFFIAPSSTSAAPLDVIISEIAWAGTTTSTADEWIELYNVTSATVDITNWTIISSDGSPFITLTGEIPPNGYFMLERTNDDSAPVLADQLYTGALINGGEVLTLTNAAAIVIDVANALGGWLAGDSTSKSSMRRIIPPTDGTLAASWQDGPVDGDPANSIHDGDSDSFGYSANIDWAVGAGSGFEALAEDCDDQVDSTYPGAVELFDVIDNDCDIEIDETFVLGELDYAVYFNSDNLYALAPTTATTPIEIAALDLISNATSTIDLAIYGFRRDSLKDALIAAHNRGVQVRVAADHGEYYGTRSAFNFDDILYGGASIIEKIADADDGNIRSNVLGELEAAGIAIYPSNYVSYLQHNKFMVVDDAIVFTGSTNWTDTGMTANMNNAIVITSSHIATAYSMEFSEMVEDGRFATAKLDDTPHVFTFTNATVEVYFSPSDLVEEKLIDVFNAAQESLDFSMFFWTSDTLGDLAVSRFMTDGIAIKGVWDALGARNAFSEDNKMCDAGIPLKIELAGGKAHNKVGVFDADGSNPVVVTGSYNWTAAGAEKNDENTLIIRNNVTIAQAYKADIMAVYDALPEATICAGGISAESGIAACSNGKDDDFDGLIDADDPNCRESTLAACTDDIDNDFDDLIDEADPDCFLLPSVPTAVTLASDSQVTPKGFAILLLFSVVTLILTSTRLRRSA